MRKVAIVTDGNCDLPKAILEKYQIHVVPFNVILESRVYKLYGNFGTITQDEFYSIIKKKKITPSTSLPPPKAFIDVFEAVLKDAEVIVAILLSSKLSATYNVAKMALDYFEGEKIYLIDSQVAASTQGLLVIEAAKMALQNLSAEEIITHIQNLIPNARLICVLDNVEATYRSGRISWGEKFLAQAFRLHPIIHFEDGLITSPGVIRGSRKKVFQKMKAIAPLVINNSITDTLFVWHVRSRSKAQRLKEEMEEVNLEGKEIIVQEAGPVIATHVGEHALAYMYIGQYSPSWLLTKKSF